MKKLNRTGYLAATFLGTGCLPLAPGTWASLAAALAGWGLLHVFACPAPAVICAAAAAACLVLSVLLAPASEAHFCAVDPARHVIDEASGQFLTMSVVFLLPGGASAAGAALSLIWFRFFDVAKPPPIRAVERLGGGWGVSLDDAVAAVYAGFCSMLTIVLI